jgi:hypothetical protein
MARPRMRDSLCAPAQTGRRRHRPCRCRFCRWLCRPCCCCLLLPHPPPSPHPRCCCRCRHHCCCRCRLPLVLLPLLPPHKTKSLLHLPPHLLLLPRSLSRPLLIMLVSLTLSVRERTAKSGALERFSQRPGGRSASRHSTPNHFRIHACLWLPAPGTNRPGSNGAWECAEGPCAVAEETSAPPPQGHEGNSSKGQESSQPARGPPLHAPRGRGRGSARSKQP